MHLIELTGLPGSGKDTVVPVVVEYLSKRGIKVFEKRQLFLESKEFPQWFKPFTNFVHSLPIPIRNKFLTLFSKIIDDNYNYLAKYILANGAFVESTMKDISDSPLPNQQKKLAALWFLNLLNFYQMSIDSLTGNTALILSEGYFHKVINFYVHLNHDLNYKRMEAYINNIPVVNVLIKVNCSIGICTERMLKRGLPKIIRGCSTSEVKKYLELSNDAINFSQNIITSKGTKIIEIDNSTSSFSRKNIIDQLFSLNDYLKPN